MKLNTLFFFLRSMCIALLLLIVSGTAKGQEDLSYFLPDTQSLNPDITTPEEFLGFQVGEWHVSHTQQVYYMKKLAEESDRIQYHSMGRTHEDRPLVHLFISHPDNLNKLEEIRQQHLSWSDPSSNKMTDDTDRPLVV